MNLELIKEKINNGEGFIQMKNAGLIRVSEMSPDDEIIWKPTKYDYKLKNNKLILKTDIDYLEDKKENLKNKLIEKIRNDIDVLFGDKNKIDEYKLILENINNVQTQEELNIIEI